MKDALPCARLLSKPTMNIVKHLLVLTRQGHGGKARRECLTHGTPLWSVNNSRAHLGRSAFFFVPMVANLKSPC